MSHDAIIERLNHRGGFECLFDQITDWHVLPIIEGDEGVPVKALPAAIGTHDGSDTWTEFEHRARREALEAV